MSLINALFRSLDHTWICEEQLWCPHLPPLTILFSKLHFSQVVCSIDFFMFKKNVEMSCILMTTARKSTSTEASRAWVRRQSTSTVHDGVSNFTYHIDWSSVNICQMHEVWRNNTLHAAWWRQQHAMMTPCIQTCLGVRNMAYIHTHAYNHTYTSIYICW